MHFCDTNVLQTPEISTFSASFSLFPISNLCKSKHFRLKYRFQWIILVNRYQNAFKKDVFQSPKKNIYWKSPPELHHNYASKITPKSWNTHISYIFASGHHTSRNWAICQFQSFWQRWSKWRWKFRKVRFPHQHTYKNNNNHHKL